MQHEYLSLTGLNNLISSKLSDEAFRDIWVRCEISELNNRGHVYLSLTETENGRLVAKTDGVIWKSSANRVLEKFRIGCSTELTKGMTVLLRGTVQHNSLHSISFIVNDVDPSFTVGHMALKAKKIKDDLTKRGVFSLNKELAIPSYFSNVAVLTPDGSAGQGDFRIDADKLMNSQLCKFTYYHATMQGLQAEESMSQQIVQINKDHALRKYDALIIIRGGGASADLSWLDNWKSALYICHSKMPVLTGLGHERDSSVLDEVAALNLGTPSKCIEHIIKSNVRLLVHIREQNQKVHLLIKNQLNNEQRRLHTLLAQCHQSTKNTLVRHCDRQSQHRIALRQQMAYALTQNAGQIANVKTLALRGCSNSIVRATATLVNTRKHIQHHSKTNLARNKEYLDGTETQVKAHISSLPTKMSQSLNHSLNLIAQMCKSLIIADTQNLSRQRASITEAYKATVLSATRSEIFLIDRVSTLAPKEAERSKQRYLELKSVIASFQPMNTLKAGYAVVRNDAGDMIRTAEDAIKHKTLNIDFQDHSITVLTQGQLNDRYTKSI